jgi:hypothetical protein
MVLHVNPAEASSLVIWLSHGQIVGRFFCSWRQRWLFDHWTVHGRDLAVAVARQRHGTACGAGNLGKFIGPAGLAVIAGSSNFVSPQATADALIPAMNYFAVWYALALVAVLFIGFETRGRTIGEIGSTLTARRSGAAAIKAPAVP